MSDPNYALQKEELQSLFRDYHWCAGAGYCESHYAALVFLKKYPKLASEKFTFDLYYDESVAGYPKFRAFNHLYDDTANRRPDDTRYVHAISYFLSAKNVNLDMVKAVYELYPSALEDPLVTEWGMTPLHVTCLSEGVREDVIRFHLDKDPLSASRVDRRGNLPLYYYLNRALSEERDVTSNETILKICNLLLSENVHVPFN